MRELDLSFNPLGPDGARWLCEAISKSDSLIKVKIAGCGFGNEELECVRAALGASSSVVAVDTAENPAVPVFHARCLVSWDAKTLHRARLVILHRIL